MARLVCFLVAIVLAVPAFAADERPNILWFVVDDMSADFGCYGQTLIETPNVDALASEGTLFRNAFVTAPVCSTCRSAMITGMYQTTIGAHQHRSGRGELKIQLPADVQPLPALFQQAGYFTCIGDGLADETAPGRNGDKNAGKKRGAQKGKTDYNFEYDPAIYDSHDWAGRSEGQPFFMQVQLPGGKLRGGSDASARKLAERAKKEFGTATDPSAVELPPYYPDHPVIRRDWAAYLDSVRLTDLQVGKVVERLKSEGILDQTFVIFMTDHGISHARGKQFLYDEGTHVPLIVRGPGVASGQVREDLIMQIDMPAISLAAAGLAIPAVMQGQDVFADDYMPRDAIFAARDRCDETVDRIRSVRTDKYLYIRNFYPDRPLLQPNAYKDGKAILQTLRRLHADNALPPLAEQLLFQPTRPAEELYLWRDDPFQIENLADDPQHADALKSHRQRLDRWMEESGDQGAEPAAMYDSDMAAYVGKGNPEVESNIATMKKWAAEGK